MGSVAPDTALIRNNTKAAKLKTHLYLESGDHPAELNYIKFIETISDGRVNSDDFNVFIFGYIAHIYTDIKWGEHKKNISKNDRNLREVLWQEEIQTDFNIYRSFTWKDRLEIDLMQAPLYEIEGFFGAEELGTWRRQIFKWLNEPKNEPNIENEYINLIDVNSFVEKTSLELSELKKNIFK